MIFRAGWDDASWSGTNDYWPGLNTLPNTPITNENIPKYLSLSLHDNINIFEGTNPGDPGG